MQEQLGEWVEEPGGSEDSSDMSTTASVDAEPSSLLDMMAAVKVLLEGLGEDVTRDGLLKTPLRVAQAFQGATGGTLPSLSPCSNSIWVVGIDSFLIKGGELQISNGGICLSNPITSPDGCFNLYFRLHLGQNFVGL